MSSSKMILLSSSDENIFSVEEAVALKFNYLVIDYYDGDTVIPLPSVSSKILTMVIEYCRRHVENKPNMLDDLKAFDANFVKVDKRTLFDLILAAKYLKIWSLLDLTCQTLAETIDGMTLEMVYKAFNIKCYLPDEEEEPWAFM
ncbi:PREDICTED: SKP1-like protein 1A [Ipomoea nil]|uniref:SKP1-like protein 1A n=1 Tax=Ipomoea nil TaxID=35883 RepID=UPI000901404F|nr:PREDICTED: SKP1-like protein 1A [Ipomoea nil]